MHPTPRPKIKICCIASIDEARLAMSAGASALGLVSAMPSGPGPIPEDRIAEIARAVPPTVATFLLTALQDAGPILAQHRRCGTSVIQLVDRVPTPALRLLRDSLPGIRIVQVIHVRGPEALEEALTVARHVDALLLDSGNQDLPVKELGGTGRTHDWRVSRAIREQVDIPVFLAGGLNAGNVRAAIEAVAPHGLDLCSGVRTGGRLDPRKLDLFFRAATAQGVNLTDHLGSA